jgi:hypothetical protein
MASIPQSPKGQAFCTTRAGSIALVINFARATKRLLTGIIDCAFENCENGFVGTAFPTPPFEFFASAATLNR